MNGMNRCFAQEGNGCKALTVKECIGDTCPFRKTADEVSASRERAYRRLASLDAETQAHISETYYGGKKPWLGDRRNKNA